MFRFLTEEEKRLRARLDQEIRKCHTNVIIGSLVQTSTFGKNLYKTF